MKRNSSGNSTLLGALVFLDGTDHDAIEMDATLEYDFVTNKVNLVILDHVLTIAIIDD